MMQTESNSAVKQL